jgi:hypothetical protein
MEKTGNNNPELLKAVIDILQATLDEALTQKPVYTLRDILPYKTVAELKDLARLSKVAGFSKMKKAELVSALCQALPKPERVKAALSCLGQKQWDFFKKAAGKKQITDNFVFLGGFLLAQEFGLLQAFLNDGNIIFVVPQEIRRVFKDMVQNGTADLIERSILIDGYACAAVNLYGIISLDELAELFNQQNAEITTADELFSVLIQNIDENSDYCFWDEYLVHSDFEEGDFEGVAALEKAIHGKARYIPPKEEFLRYAEPDYYEPTPLTEKLEAFIMSSFAQNEMEALKITDEIVLTCMSEAPIKDVMSVFDKHGIVFQSKGQVEKLTPLLMDVWNNARIWSNKGHTPNEMTDKNGRPILRVLPGSGKKPGRNEPCPCGSGKKYKKCCGRND